MSFQSATPTPGSPAPSSSFELLRIRQREPEESGQRVGEEAPGMGSAPRQQLHRQNLSCGIVPVPPEEETGVQALLAHPQGHSQQNFPLTLDSQWHIWGRMLLTLVLRDLHFCGRKHTEHLGQESEGKQQCFIHFCLVSHKLLLTHFSTLANWRSNTNSQPLMSKNTRAWILWKRSTWEEKKRKRSTYSWRSEIFRSGQVFQG